VPFPNAGLAPGSDSFPDLMKLIYASRRFAKMLAVPDKLIETPHTYAGGDLLLWTHSTRSWARFA
jgi:hypothetical protein